MNFDQEELKDQFLIKFEGDGNQIDANTLVNYLIHFNTILQEINKEIAPDRRIKIKVNALTKGSFIVGIEVQSFIEQVRLLLSKDNVEYLSAAFAIYQGLIYLRTTLAGDKPKEVKRDGGSIEITKNDGTIIQVDSIVYNIYGNNNTVSQAITKQFETLNADPEIDSVEILNRNEEKIVEIEREEFAVLAQPSDITESPIRIYVHENAKLNIIKLSFDPKLKSDFYLQGNKITAHIKDVEFYDRVDKGEQFAKGDSLEVTLHVTKFYDSSVDTEVIKGFEIVKVHHHHPRGDGGQLSII